MSLVIHTRFPDVTHPKFDYKEWNRQFVSNNVIIYGNYSSAYFDLHWTPFSMKSAFNGMEYYIIDKIKYSVDDSNYLITNNDTYYESLINSASRVESFTLNFCKEFVLGVFESISNTDEFLLDYPEIKEKDPVNFFQKLYPQDYKIVDYLSKIKKLIKQELWDAGLINEYMHCILDRLFFIQFDTYRDSERFEAKKKSTRLELYKRLNWAKDYIRSNYGERIELNELGRLSCLSAHHLLRKFKSVFGITPHQYLTSIRLESAKEMLSSSSKSVTEICLSIGFESLSSFGDLFKRKYGISPHCFRKT